MPPRLRAVLDTDPRTEADHIGYLRFEAPDGRIDIIPVTDLPTFDIPTTDPKRRIPVWHIDIEPGDTALVTPGIQLRGQIIVSPSIDIKDRYHTANPIRFDLVVELPAKTPV